MDAIQEQLVAFNGRNLDRFVASYAPDVVIEDGAGNVLTRGHGGLRAMYGPVFAQSPNLHADVVSRIAVGEYVIDEERASGINSPDYPSEMHSAVVYRMVDGKIAHVRLLM